MYLHVSACACTDAQMRVSHPMELKSEAVVSCPTWITRTELRSPTEAVHVLNHQAILPAPAMNSLTFKPYLNLDLAINDCLRYVT